MPKPGTEIEKLVDDRGQEVDQVWDSSDDGAEIARALGFGYEIASPGEPFGSDVEGASMVIIQLSGGVMNRVHVTEEWLMEVLPDGPRQQIENAVLVIATDPNVRLCQVIKAEAKVQDMLVIHTVALG